MSRRAVIKAAERWRDVHEFEGGFMRGAEEARYEQQNAAASIALRDAVDGMRRRSAWRHWEPLIGYTPLPVFGLGVAVGLLLAVVVVAL